MILALLDVAREIPSSVETGTVVSLVLGGFKFWDRRYGRKRDNALHQIMEDVKKIKWHVTGPDGDTGLVQEVQTLKETVTEIIRHLPPENRPPRR